MLKFPSKFIDRFDLKFTAFLKTFSMLHVCKATIKTIDM